MTQYSIKELQLTLFWFIMQKGRVCTIEFSILNNMSNISFKNAPDYYSLSPKTKASLNMLYYHFGELE